MVQLDYCRKPGAAISRYVDYKVVRMQKLFFVAAMSAVWCAAAAAQDAAPFLGRWDFTVTPASGAPYPQWMELKENGGKIEGRVQPRGGAWKPVVSATAEGGRMVVIVSSGRGPEVRWELSSAGAGKLSGIEKRGGENGPMLSGLRAPSLDRPVPKAWGKAKPIFNGRNLDGWEPVGNVANSKWVARDGELVNDNPEVPGQTNNGAANIKTVAKFQDFKLHIEVNCPEHGNSGIYLRGRYEVQVGTEGGTLPDHEMGAIYSYYPPPAGAENDLGKWTAFDITLVGRHVTVLRDGKMYHDNVEIPGPTGGALDSNEAEPGPFYLQGDHHGVIRYRTITVAVPAK